VPKRILIVDDSPVIRKTLRETLADQDGWEICGEAANGREAIQKAQQLKPDVIVLDLSMPVMNGLDAARELTRLAPSVPLLMFTNFETARLKQEALSAGVRTLNLSATHLDQKAHRLSRAVRQAPLHGPSVIHEVSRQSQALLAECALLVSHRRFRRWLLRTDLAKDNRFSLVVPLLGIEEPLDLAMGQIRF